MTAELSAADALAGAVLESFAHGRLSELARAYATERLKKPLDAGIEPIDRLREMFGIEATDPAAVFAALEAYDQHMHRTLGNLLAEISELRDVIGEHAADRAIARREWDA